MEKNILASKIGSNIKRLREEKGLSQNDLAEKTGFSFSQISKYERGYNTPGGKNLKKLAEALGVTEEEITSSGTLPAHGGQPLSNDPAAAMERLMELLPPPAQELVRRMNKMDLAAQYQVVGKALEVIEEIEKERKKKKEREGSPP